MTADPWFKFYTSSWLADTSGLTATERGVLITLLALAQKSGEAVPLQEKRLYRSCGLPKGQFRKALATLIDLGFLETDGVEITPVLIDKWALRSRREDARPAIPQSLRRFVEERDGYCCVYCGDEAGPFHLDHRIPWSRGGAHSADNLALACVPCNLAKSDRTDEEFLGLRS